MPSQVVVHDVPMFAVIYLVCLLGFAHAHFLAAGTLRSGPGPAAESRRRTFAAVGGGGCPRDAAPRRL